MICKRDSVVSGSSEGRGDDVDGVQLWTQPRSTMVTPHPHAVTVLREKGVDVTSHNKRTDTVVVVVGQRGGSSWIQE